MFENVSSQRNLVVPLFLLTAQAAALQQERGSTFLDSLLFLLRRQLYSARAAFSRAFHKYVDVTHVDLRVPVTLDSVRQIPAATAGSATVSGLR